MRISILETKDAFLIDEGANMGVVDFQKYRDRFQGEKYRLLQAAAMLKLFEQANGRGASTSQELEEWLEGSDIKVPIDPFVILTRDEIEAKAKTWER